MTSKKQIDANRQNARKSTGPKTTKGKQRSKRNSLKHGLATAIISGSPEDAEIQKLADAIIGKPQPNLETLIHSRAAAEAQFKIQRIRAHQVRILKECDIAQICFANDLDPTPGAPNASTTLDHILSHLVNLDSYERKARSRRNKALTCLREID